jgi:hypothetical protein
MLPCKDLDFLHMDPPNTYICDLLTISCSWSGLPPLLTSQGILAVIKMIIHSNVDIDDAIKLIIISLKKFSIIL